MAATDAMAMSSNKSCGDSLRSSAKINFMHHFKLNHFFKYFLVGGIFFNASIMLKRWHRRRRQKRLQVVGLALTRIDFIFADWN
jgi:hypothetical protein